MKRIAFIDIHPQSRLLGGPQVCDTQQAENECGDVDKSAVYVFRSAKDGYVHEATLNYASLDELGHMDAYFVSLPAAAVDFRILTFPFSDKKKIEDVLPLELSGLILADPEGIICDSLVLRNYGSSVDVLAVYAAKPLLARILAELAHKNIDPRTITSLDLRYLGTGEQHSDQVGFLNSTLGGLQEWDEDERAQAAVQEIAEPTINLRKGRFAYTKDSARTGKALRAAAILALLLGLVLQANIVFQAVAAMNESSAMVEKMRISYRSLFPNEKKTVDELYQLKSHVRETKEIGADLSGVSPLHVLRELSSRMTPNVVYTDIYLEKGLLKMKAEAQSMDDLNKLRARLSDLLPDLSISDVRPESHGKILFSIVAKRTP